MAEDLKNSGDAAQPQGDQPAQPAEAADTAEAAGDGLPPNQVTILDSGPSKKKITIEIDRKRIDAKFNEIFGELHRTAQVPGFRIGRAPRRLLERRFGKEAAQDVRNGLLAEALGKIDQEHDLKILGEPDIKLDEIELPESGNLIFDVEVEVKPDFELADYKAIAVTEPSVEATPQRVEQATRRFLAQRGTLGPTTEPAGEEDLVVADVAIKGDGIDARHPNLELRVAPAAVDGVPLPELGERLTGRATGEQVALEATVPDGHEREDWRGKTVSVTFDLKEVKRLELPPLDDAVAGEFGFDTAAEFTAFVARNLEAQLAMESRQAMREQVCNHLLGATKLELPEGLAARHAARMLARRYVDLLYRGVPRDQIEQNMELLEARVGEEARRDMALGFILERIAQAESIEVTEGEVNARIAEMASRQSRRPERLRTEMANQGTLDQVEVQLREQRTLDRILEMANITQAPPPSEPAKPAAKPAAKGEKAAKQPKKAAAKAAKTAAKADKKPKAAAAKTTAKKTAKNSAKKSAKGSTKKSGKKAEQ